MKKWFRIVHVGHGSETIKTGKHHLRIQDVSVGCGVDEIHPLLFKRGESIKLVEYLNNLDEEMQNSIVNPTNYRIHWGILSDLKQKLGFGDYMYFKENSLEFKEHVAQEKIALEQFEHGDEITNVSKETFEAAMPKLDNVDPKKIIITSTPKGKNFFYETYKEYFEKKSKSNVVIPPDTRIISSDTPPIEPFIGQLYFDTIVMQVKIFDGENWVIVQENNISSERYRFLERYYKKMEKWKRIMYKFFVPAVSLLILDLIMYLASPLTTFTKYIPFYWWFELFK